MQIKLDLNFETRQLTEDNFLLIAEDGKLLYNLPLSLNTIFIKKIITDDISKYAQCSIEEADEARKEILSHQHYFNPDGICEECGYIKPEEITTQNDEGVLYD